MSSDSPTGGRAIRRRARAGLGAVMVVLGAGALAPTVSFVGTMTWLFWPAANLLGLGVFLTLPVAGALMVGGTWVLAPRLRRRASGAHTDDRRGETRIAVGAGLALVGIAVVVVLAQGANPRDPVFTIYGVLPILGGGFLTMAAWLLSPFWSRRPAPKPAPK